MKQKSKVIKHTTNAVSFVPSNNAWTRTIFQTAWQKTVFSGCLTLLSVVILNFLEDRAVKTLYPILAAFIASRRNHAIRYWPPRHCDAIEWCHSETIMDMQGIYFLQPLKWVPPSYPSYFLFFSSLFVFLFSLSFSGALPKSSWRVLRALYRHSQWGLWLDTSADNFIS